MSSFKDNDLFGSGPHRFADEPRGQQMVLRFALGQALPGSVSLGTQELNVIVRGRLIAEDDAGLDAILANIQSELNDFANVGTLVGHHDRTWTAMKFARFEPGERRDRGHSRSLAYTARFYHP
ncbi:MAG: hypothetical protein ACT4PL_11255 [Phycisphaerales bacterium]